MRTFTMSTFARRLTAAAAIVTMGMALAACDAGTTDGTAPGQELPADDGGDLGGGGDDLGGGDDTGGDLGG